MNASNLITLVPLLLFCAIALVCEVVAAVAHARAGRRVSVRVRTERRR